MSNLLSIKLKNKNNQEMSNQKEENVKVWSKVGSKHFYGDKAEELSELSQGVYLLKLSDNGFYLDKFKENFDLPAKVYGHDNIFAERCVKTFEKTKNQGNIGVLLNGVKGTGKSVTAKTICNLSKLPVILVTSHFGNPVAVSDYLGTIRQNITVFVDEYEKIYGDSDGLLTLMDGAFSGKYRRFFVLTSNERRVSSYMLDRPSRIRYNRSYDQLDRAVIEEMVDDLLDNKSLREDVLKFFSKLSILTIDIVGQVLDEVNIHDEVPTAFEDYFNISINPVTYKVIQVLDNGNQEVISFMHTGATEFDLDDLGDSIYAGGKYLGSLVNVDPKTSLLTVKYRKSHAWNYNDGLKDLKDGAEINIYFEEGTNATHTAFADYTSNTNLAVAGMVALASGAESEY